VITQGVNKLNAILSCLGNPGLELSYTVNVIGISEQEQQPSITIERDNLFSIERDEGTSSSSEDSSEDPFKFVVFCTTITSISSSGSESSGGGSSGGGSSGGEKPKEEKPKEEKPKEEKPKEEKPKEEKPKEEEPKEEEPKEEEGPVRKKIVDKNGNGFEDEIEEEKEKLMKEVCPDDE